MPQVQSPAAISAIPGTRDRLAVLASQRKPAAAVRRILPRRMQPADSHGTTRKSWRLNDRRSAPWGSAGAGEERRKGTSQGPIRSSRAGLAMPPRREHSVSAFPSLAKTCRRRVGHTWCHTSTHLRRPKPFGKLRPGLAPGPRSNEVKNQRGERPGNTEPEIVEPVTSRAPDAERGAEVPRFVVPGTAAQNAHAAFTFRSPAVPSDGAPRSFVPAILNPFPHVTVHIVQPEPVRPKRTHRGRPVIVPAAAATVAIGAVRPTEFPQ